MFCNIVIIINNTAHRAGAPLPFARFLFLFCVCAGGCGGEGVGCVCVGGGGGSKGPYSGRVAFCSVCNSNSSRPPTLPITRSSGAKVCVSPPDRGRHSKVMADIPDRH